MLQPPAAFSATISAGTPRNAPRLPHGCTSHVSGGLIISAHANGAKQCIRFCQRKILKWRTEQWRKLDRTQIATDLKKRLPRSLALQKQEKG